LQRETNDKRVVKIRAKNKSIEKNMRKQTTNISKQTNINKQTNKHKQT